MRGRGPVSLTLALALAALLLLPVRGADAVPALPIDQTDGVSGTVVTVTPTFGSPSECTLYFDNAPVQTFVCGASDFNYPSTSLIATAAPGAHTISVCAPSCASVDQVPEESASFLILSVVPDLTGLTANAAAERLKAAGLALGQVDRATTDPTATISGQRPGVGLAVNPGTAVTVFLAPPLTSPSTIPVTVSPSTVAVTASPSIIHPARTPVTVALTGTTVAGTHTTTSVVTAIVTGIVLLAFLVAVTRMFRRRTRRPMLSRPAPVIRPRVEARADHRVVSVAQTGPRVGPDVELHCRHSVTITIERSE